MPGGGGLIDDLRLELSCASRVGELEASVGLLRHKLELGATELIAARGRITDLEMELEERSSAMALHGSEMDEEVGRFSSVALRAKAAAEAELANCRARLWDAQQLAESRAGDLAGLRGQLKEKALESKAVLSRHVAATAALERDKQALSVELNISRERGKAALAVKSKSLQELAAALQSSQQQVARLRQALQAGDSSAASVVSTTPQESLPPENANSATLLALEAAAAEASSLRQAYEAAVRETREATEEATRCSALLDQSGEDLTAARGQAAAMGEDLALARGQLAAAWAETAELRTRLEAALAEAAEAHSQSEALALTLESTTHAIRPEVSNQADASVSALPIIEAAPSQVTTTKTEAVQAQTVVATKEDLSMLIESYRQKLLSAGAVNSTFGWIGRARQSRDAHDRDRERDRDRDQVKGTSVGSPFPSLDDADDRNNGDSEEPLLHTHDISLDHPDSDDELALPSLDEADVYTAGLTVVGAALVGNGSTELEGSRKTDIPPTVVTVSVSALLGMLVDRDATAGNGSGGGTNPSKNELRLQSEKANLLFERDSYREEIFRFLEIDAALSSAAATPAEIKSALGSVSSTPASSPSKSDRAPRTPGQGGSATSSSGGGKRAGENHAQVASAVAAASSAVNAVHAAAGSSTPKRTMAIVRGFAESNGRLQAQVVSLAQQLDESRLQFQRVRQAEQTVTLDLMRAEEHNQQLTRALNLALSSHKDAT